MNEARNILSRIADTLEADAIRRAEAMARVYGAGSRQAIEARQEARRRTLQAAAADHAARSAR